MEIRRATINDAEAIAKIHIDTWRSTYRGIIPDEKLDNMDLQKDIEMQRVFISNPEISTYVYVDESSKPIGFVCCGREREGTEGYEGELYGIYILKEYQNKGIGKKLVKEVAGDLKKRGYKSMLLWALKENSSCRFYEKLGGLVLGEKILTYAGKNVDAVAYGWKSI